MCGHHRTGPDGLVTKSDEELIWSGKISWKSIIVPLLAALVGTIFFSIIVAVESPVAGFFIFIIFTIGIVIAAVLHKIRSEYAVTTQRVYSRSGIISRKATDARFERITDVTLVQGVLGRLMKYGKIKFNTAGSAFHEVVMSGVNRPKDKLKIYRECIKLNDNKQRFRDMLKDLKYDYYTNQIDQDDFNNAKKEIQNEINSLDLNGIYGSAQYDTHRRYENQRYDYHTGNYDADVQKSPSNKNNRNNSYHQQSGQDNSLEQDKPHDKNMDSSQENESTG